MKELKMEELSVRQKLGMVLCEVIRHTGDYENFDESLKVILERIRNHSLGAIWVLPHIERRDEIMKKIHEAADYPILIFTDAESGLGEYTIGRHNALGVTGSEELAYMFGKVTALTARKMGYNVICSPVLDMVTDWRVTSANVRSLGSDKYQVAKLAAAEARGLHDGGVLTVGKHYPGGVSKLNVDTHMVESPSEETKEELLEYYLYPYLELMKRELLDGIMISHRKFINIDPEYPATLSQKVIDIIREQDFDGFAITDALNMMGIKAKFGDTTVNGMCVEAGNDLILPFSTDGMAYKHLCDCYDEGIISDERLDEAVRRVLEAQHKVLSKTPKFTEITQEDIEMFDRINRDGIYARVDEGLEVPVSQDGKHFFVVIVRNGTDIAADGKVAVDTFTNVWYNPNRIIRKLEKLFPNSAVRAIYQFPTPAQNMGVLEDSLGYEDVIFITYTEAPAFVGTDHLTRRIVALIKALQMSGRISTVVHFGNPFVLEELLHIPRLIIGGVSSNSISAGLDVLAGAYPAKGVLTYDVNFK